MMGAMSNDPAKLAHFAGLYKSIQSAGGAVAWRMDGLKERGLLLAMFCYPGIHVFQHT